ncbi:YNFM family putative membrane transporter [Rhodobacter viridis]|uniref:YNFM family putative membrane transporter n=1 Tax=Rhodobacter viridis TaxID=1054202 RepID=A0A318TXV0_9RHOB|nr:MFS transporter [Rhodobacter viridis]PYF08730.1 YNFM family putative membrane transporter [Rhodobacter viridis]
MTAAPVAPQIARGTAPFARIRLALFLAGFASFAAIYCVQPLLPAFSKGFQVSPAQSSLALSLTTGALAGAIMAMAGLSQRLGRKAVMAGSMFAGAALTLAVARLGDWHALLAARFGLGLAMGGVPAVAMAYLAEEIRPADLGRAMGLYIGGTAFGAMMGRVGMGGLAELLDWRGAMAVLGGLCLLAALGFALLLPPSRHFTPRAGIGLAGHLRLWAGHLRRPALQRLYAMGFCLTSVFVTLFNYATFRLSAPPFGLTQGQVSLIFLAFGLGVVASPLAGRLADRFGRGRLLQLAFGLILIGSLATLPASLAAMASGVALVTTGFFIGHAVVSSAVGAVAEGAKGHASSLYLLFYYAGSSLTGSLGGWFWQHLGWPGVVGLTVTAALAGLLLSLRPVPAR